MRRIQAAAFLPMLVLAAAACAQKSDAPAATSQPAGGKPAAAAQAPAGGALDFTVKDIDGKDVALAARYKGRVVLVVNVASKCGLTPQYEQLEQVYEKYKERGLRIAAFPANNFGAQEPGTNAEIKDFCTSKYKASFDMYSKISVKGDDQAPLYRFLTAKETNGDFAGEIKWNFTKFLVDRTGKVVARFEPKTKPDDPEVIKALEAALSGPGGPSTGEKPAEKPAAKPAP